MTERSAPGSSQHRSANGPPARAAERREGEVRERDRLFAELPDQLRRVSTFPRDAPLLRALSLSYSRLACLDARLSPGSSRAWLEKDLAVREEIARLEPGNDFAAAGLATGLWRLARAVEHDDPHRARTLLAAALEIRDRLAEEAPGDTHRAEMVALTCGGLGRLDGRTDPARGMTWLARAEAIRTRISEARPGSVEALHDLAFSRLALARMEEKLSVAAAARAHERWLSTIEQCLGLRPADDDLQLDRALAALDLAEALEAEGDPGAADATRRAVVLFRGLARSRPEDPYVHVGLGRACLALESLLHRGGRSEGRAAIAREHDRAMRRAERLGASGPWFELLRARSLSLREKTEAALAAIESAVVRGLDDPDVLLRAAELRPLRSHARFRDAYERAAGGPPSPDA